MWVMGVRMTEGEGERDKEGLRRREGEGEREKDEWTRTDDKEEGSRGKGFGWKQINKSWTGK